MLARHCKEVRLKQSHTWNESASDKSPRNDARTLKKRHCPLALTARRLFRGESRKRVVI